MHLFTFYMQIFGEKKRPLPNLVSLISFWQETEAKFSYKHLEIVNKNGC